MKTTLTETLKNQTRESPYLPPLRGNMQIARSGLFKTIDEIGQRIVSEQHARPGSPEYRNEVVLCPVHRENVVRYLKQTKSNWICPVRLCEFEWKLRKSRAAKYPVSVSEEVTA